MKEFVARQMSSIEAFIKNPQGSQEQILDTFIKKNKHTFWGKKYNYKQIKDYEQFKNNVPVSTYEQIFPYIERMMKGEENVLWHDKIHCFAKSSGTTNAKSKFIPVSKESLENTHYRGGKDMLAMYYHNYPDAKMFTGKGLAIGGSYENNPLNPKTYYGDISALIMKNLPLWAQLHRSPKLSTALMSDWNTKLDCIAKEAINENITTIQGVPTWTIFIIRRVLELTGKSNILEVWENLEAFFHGAVAFTPYQNLFKEMIPSNQMRYVEIYNASEGSFAFQDQKDSKDMLLLLNHGIFYEFMPLDELENPKPKTLSIAEVELDKAYAMIISTNGGLWRYNIGDTIKFTSLYPHRIRITGRTKHFINAFGEEVVIENAEMAIAKACEKTEASINNFTVAPIYIEEGKRGGHQWAIEFESLPNDFDDFSKTLDQSLRDINSDYNAKRYNDIALQAPKIEILKKGTFYRWMEKQNKLGGQNKVPRLSNDRKYLESILELV